MTPLHPATEPHPAPGAGPRPPRRRAPTARPPQGADGAPPSSAPWLQREWDLPALVGLLWRRRWLVAAAVGLGLLLALLMVAQWPPSYTAEAVVLVDPEAQPKVEFEELLTGATPDDQRLSSEVLVLRAPDLAASVVRRLNLAARPDFNPDLPQRLPPYALWRALPADWVAAVAGWLGLVAPEPPLAPEARLEAKAQRVLAAFADRLEVERIGRSHALRIAVTGHDAGLAADAANALADAYLDQQLAAKHAATAEASAWLDKRIADLRARAEEAERAVEDYRVATGLIDANGSTVTTQQLAELNTQLVTARAETAAARARLSQVRAELRQSGDALAAAEVLSSPLIHRLKEQEVEVLRQRAELAQEYGPKHPRMLSVQAELADIQAKIAAEVRQIVAGLSNAVAVAEAQEAALRAALRHTEAAAADQGKAQVRLHALEREAEAARDLLQTFLLRTKQTGDQQEIQRPDARIIARASPPERPSEPRQALVLGGFGAVSLLLGLAAALLLGLREQGLGDRGFGAAAALRVRLGVPVLGAVPQQKARRGATPADAVADAPLGAIAEALRMVASGLAGAPSCWSRRRRRRRARPLSRWRSPAPWRPRGGGCCWSMPMCGGPASAIWSGWSACPAWPEALGGAAPARPWRWPATGCAGCTSCRPAPPPRGWRRLAPATRPCWPACWRTGACGLTT
ncbi:MAG: GumC family protein [Alphaproteobacteria bacterium]|nr:GumC family protein [Alphaproteobacteria bacterium]